MGTPGDGTEPISDDEILYRRIPESENLYDPAIGAPPSFRAFRPRPYDTTGLSLYRAKYTTPEQVAENDRGKRFYIAELRAGDLRRHGITVTPAPLPELPGHAEIPTLTNQNRTTDRAEALQVLLAENLCIRVLGPFP